MAESVIPLASNLNFDDAIQAHAAWKMKLSAYLRKPDGSLKAVEIEPDHKCALGKWIHGDGKKHSAHAEYSTLKSEHAKFHKAAAEVVRKADSGRSTSEETALGGNSEFAATSQAVIAAILAMKSKSVSAANVIPFDSKPAGGEFASTDGF